MLLFTEWTGEINKYCQQIPSDAFHQSARIRYELCENASDVLRESCSVRKQHVAVHMPAFFVFLGVARRLELSPCNTCPPDMPQHACGLGTTTLSSPNQHGPCLKARCCGCPWQAAITNRPRTNSSQHAHCARRIHCTPTSQTAAFCTTAGAACRLGRLKHRATNLLQLQLIQNCRPKRVPLTARLTTQCTAPCMKAAEVSERFTHMF